MNQSRISGLYTFIDITYCPQLTHEQLARELLGGGAKILQLRAKRVPRREFLGLAERIKLLQRKRPFIFIINDDPWVARAVGADGVHLGQQDVSIDAARRILGPQKIIGLSTHNEAQFRAGMREDVTYLALGPIFPTQTKDEYPPVGLELLNRLVPQTTLPVVAIGGVNEANREAVRASGVAGICMISALTKQQNVRQMVRCVLSRISSTDLG